MSTKQKLELNWIGKHKRPRLEPRILLEDKELSYGDTDNDNLLIHGDNLLALKALEQKYAGKVKCAYIDPPFNTGEAFENYDDGLEHSQWLTLIRDRIEIIQRLLSIDGTFFVHIDDNELGYLIVLLDEIFGRQNRVNIVTFKQGSATGHKSINPGLVTTTNYLIVYAKSKQHWKPNRLFTARERDSRYSQYIVNIDEHYSTWEYKPLGSIFAESLKMKPSEAKKKLGDNYEEKLNDFVLSNAERVIRTARPDYNSVGQNVRGIIDLSKKNEDEILKLEREGYPDMYFTKGDRILFYKDKLKNVDGQLVAGEPLTNLWSDILSNNLHKEGGIKFPKGKKPEFLIKRILDLCSSPNDLILDSFAGSGTTAAVAHKMNRRWITIELGDQAFTHVQPRLKRVVTGIDQDGVSKAVNWKGGGGFRYLRLAPSLLKKDHWGNWVINKEYNAEMLAEAMCKHMNFTYAPSQTQYWNHGYSTETDYIYVTTGSLAYEQLKVISEEVGTERTLLICCKAFMTEGADFPNLTLVKIPRAILSKCEWDQDDYSFTLNVLSDSEQPGDIDYDEDTEGEE
ncbi:type III restriction-modification system methylation subunit [Raoultella planticola]|uniref:site-specific DNA-methyltransferase (adenine-specific) n=1 Tax=Raoultella planticola TaxID=575 RepID=A0A8G2EBC9_RAOPL|nr:site-specific DNA-methyltransferase [Raoultella planticola]MBE0093878.1 site-specific DNA-methyltransferase [Raoultella planticola]SBL80419.1 type III restriction-modification system methylation subunit [Raoultella planticola]HEM8823640.1 site-specific DNA-methyltransferase [Raoultella planticola]